MPNTSHYNVGDPQVDKLIEELTGICCKDHPASSYFREIVTTVAKLAKESRDVGAFKLVNTALKEIRYSEKVFTPYRQIRKVVIFGSARTPREDACYQLARDLAKALAEAGLMVVTGAGGGIMAAGNEGAGPKMSFGINIKLPHEQEANPYILDNPRLITLKYFFTRKLMFIKETDATVLFPGGFGTLDEGFENLTLFQTGKTLPRPIILMEPEGGTYWTRCLEFLESELFQAGYLSDFDRRLYKVATSIKDACKVIHQYYRIYHSLRYVGGLTVLRLNRSLGQGVIDQLNSGFSDILNSGKIESSGPLDNELENIEFPDLPRLVMNFDKRSYGRLNELINTINETA